MEGNVSSEHVAKCMRSYANQSGETGFWLDWLDALLFAKNNGKKLAFINYGIQTGAEGHLSIECAESHVAQIPGFDGDVDDTVSRTSDTWLLVSCNSEWDRSGPVNHWVPAVFKEVVATSTYRELVAQQIARLQVQIVSLQSDLLDVGLEDDPEMAAQTSHSINEAISS